MKYNYYIAYDDGDILIRDADEKNSDGHYPLD